MSQPLVLVKGQIFRTGFAAIEKMHGADGVRRVVDALPDEVRAAWCDRLILPGGWYSPLWYDGLHLAMQKCFGGGGPAAREFGRVTTEIDTKGIYGFLLLLVTPELLLKNVPKVWSTYFKGGRIEVTVPKPRQVTIRARECWGLSRLIWDEACGGWGYLVERSGGRSVVVEGPYITTPGEALIETRWA